MSLTLSPRLTQELLRLPLFSGVSPAAIEDFLEEKPRRGFNHGQALFHQGDSAGPMFIILEGAVMVARKSSIGEHIKLAQLGPGQVLGELSVLSPAPRSATAVGVGQGGVAEVSRGDLELGLALADPVAIALLRNLSVQICERIRATDDKLVRLHALLHGTPPAVLEQNLRGLMEEPKSKRLGRDLVKWLRSRS